MAKVGLSRAAELTGKSASTIHRAMRKGRLSFETDEHGSRLVDVSELERVFGVQYPAIAGERVHGMPRTGAEALHTDGASLVQVRADLSVERVKSTMLEERVRELQERLEDVSKERDEWRQQAQTLLLTHRQPTPPEPSANTLSEGAKPGPHRGLRRWWQWFVVVAL